MSGLMLRYGMREADAYRVCMLLSRNLPLSFLLERLNASGVDLVTLYDAAYPARIRGALGEKAPPTLFLRGRPEIFRQNAIAILVRCRPAATRRRTCARWSGRRHKRIM
jgi:predicted Rossmann fold nucleotide-binding protein DprA/Smf involved in DNA uptake